MGMILLWRWPWASVAAALAAALILGALWLSLHKRRPPEPHGEPQSALVWNVRRDMAGEHTSLLLRTWRRGNRAAALLLAGMLVLGIALVGRPSSVDAGQERRTARDIVLCLDVSGSALPYDREVIAAYRELVEHFRGERIALSIFNSTSRSVFPLTDDYTLVADQLRDAESILQGVQSQDDIDNMSSRQYQRIADWLEGTQNRKDATSLIGDGLVGCAAMLPGFTYHTQNAGDRSRPQSIILATDNVTSGTPTYSFEQALTLTRAAGIVVDGLFTGPSQSERDATTTQMQRGIERHDGVFLTRESAASVGDVVRSIERQRTAESRGASRSGLTDAPGWFTLALALLYAAFLAVTWRLRR